MSLFTQLLAQLNRLDINEHDLKRFLSYFKTYHFPVDEGAKFEVPSEKEKLFGETDSWISRPELFPDMDGTPYLPVGEIQMTKFTDLKNCVTQALLAHIQSVQHRKYAVKDNRAQRFTAKMSNTTQSGNSVTNVMGSIRKDKTAAEERWPMAEGMTWDQYYSVIPSDVIQEALMWGYQTPYWFIDLKNDQEVRAAFKRFGSVVVGGLAWYLKNGLYFSPINGSYNHMFVRAKYTPPGATYLARDSYPPFYKNLNPDFDFYRYGTIVDVVKVAGTTDGEKLYNVLLGKMILLTEQAENHVKGEAYRLYPDHWEKPTIIISDKKLYDDAHDSWRTKKSFVGVNAKVFLTLKKHYQDVFGEAKIVDQIEHEKYGLADFIL